MPRTIDFIDCQGFAGGFTAGAVQAGLRLVGKRELPGAFGVASCEVNRHILGEKWQTQVSLAAEWQPLDVPIVLGNPPCSGFSLLSRADFRGSSSPVNSCMRSFIDYAAKCQPEIVMFESVQQAYKIGRDLMQELRADMEAKTGRSFELIHVLHNALSVGGCAMRKRYFFVVSAIPFGIEPPMIARVPTLIQAIGDLEGLSITWDKQPYRRPPTWWSKQARSAKNNLVDGHYHRINPLARRAQELMDEVEWPPGACISDVARGYYQRFGRLPKSWSASADKLIANDFKMGFYQLHRWKPESMARVVTGAAVQLVLHPTENRLLTNREVARIQGFPDDWFIGPLRMNSGVDMLWGKGIPVQCGKWIAGWAREALKDNPGSYTGNEIGDRERLIDCTNDHIGAVIG